MKRILTVALALMAQVIFAGESMIPSPEIETQINNRRDMVGKEIMDVEFRGTEKGQTVYLQDYQNKVVLLYFWTVQNEKIINLKNGYSGLDVVKALQKEFKINPDIKMLSINVVDTHEQVMKFLAGRDYAVEMVSDVNCIFYQQQEVGPMTFLLVDEKGKIIRVMDGLSKMTEGQLKASIHVLLEDKRLSHMKRMEKILVKNQEL